jgi:molybdopterin-biosynthesis enzyme MoeA-like protein
MTTMRAAAAQAFGLIVIGDEILTGHRQDAHFLHFRELLRGRGHTLAWCWLLPDDPDTLVSHLEHSLAQERPVLCCGGIGATPDDRTRECAARAAGLPLERHPAAAEEIEARFGPAAYPTRILMADLPRGCALIPNPYNRIPGFRLARHYFLPGFPELAWPMADWVLEQDYPGTAEPLGECAVRVLDTPESALVPLMERLGRAYPALKVFSLPRLAGKGVELGLRGRQDLDRALAELRAGLEAEGFPYEELDG